MLRALTLLFVTLLVTPAHAGKLSDDAFAKLKKQIATAAGQPKSEFKIYGLLLDVSKDDSKRAVDLIVRTALRIRNGRVLEATDRALATMYSDEASEALAALIESKKTKPAMKVVCIDACRMRSDKRTGKALGVALGDKRPAIVRAALTAIRKRRPAEAIKPLIDLLGKLDKKKKKANPLIAHEAERTLYNITGKSFESLDGWKKFWRAKGASFRPQTGRGWSKAPPKSRLRSQRRPPARFFGTEIPSNRVVFVIDNSGSMTHKNRIKKVKAQLIKCLKGLSSRTRFTVIAFSDHITTWKNSLQSASKKGAAIGWVKALPAAGQTHTLTAIRTALSVKGNPDTLVILSDGTPTETDDKGKVISETTILDEVRLKNNARRLRIHTFGFGGGGGRLGAFMKKLAEAHGGVFTPLKDDGKP